MPKADDKKVKKAMIDLTAELIAIAKQAEAMKNLIDEQDEYNAEFMKELAAKTTKLVAKVNAMAGDVKSVAKTKFDA